MAFFRQLEGHGNELGPNRRKLETIQGQYQTAVGKLTDDQLDVIAGKRQHLSGKIQEVYGITKEETEKQISDWQARQKDQPH